MILADAMRRQCLKLYFGLHGLHQVPKCFADKFWNDPFASPFVIEESAQLAGSNNRHVADLRILVDEMVVDVVVQLFGQLIAFVIEQHVGLQLVQVELHGAITKTAQVCYQHILLLEANSLPTFKTYYLTYPLSIAALHTICFAIREK